MMIANIRAFCFIVVAMGAWSACAQPVTDSNEPPVPRAAPLAMVKEVSLPRFGGILLFGASKSTGLEVARELVKRGEKVSAMVREPSESAALESLGIIVVKGDPLVPEDVARAFASAPFRAVVSTMDGTRTDVTVDFEGNRNVIDAAKTTGIPRVVLVSAVGAGDSRNARPWYLALSRQTYLGEKTKAENYLRASKLEYTIIRSGTVIDRPPSTKAVLNPDHTKFSWIARGDLARLVVDGLQNDANVNKVLTAYDGDRDTPWKIFF